MIFDSSLKLVNVQLLLYCQAVTKQSFLLAVVRLL